MEKFNTTLDKYLFSSNGGYVVEVRNKNNTVFKTERYSISFSIDDIFKRTQELYKKKDVYIKRIPESETF